MESDLDFFIMYRVFSNNIAAYALDPLVMASFTSGTLRTAFYLERHAETYSDRLSKGLIQ